MKGETYITYGNDCVPYNVIPNAKRAERIAIHVEPDGAVTVEAPTSADETDIHRAVQKRARWVFSHVKDAQARFLDIKPKAYISGEEILYLGRRYVLKVLTNDEARRPARLKGNRLEVPVTSNEANIIRAKVWAWYRIKGRDYFARRITTLVSALPWVSNLPSFEIKTMEKRWGSCSSSGHLVLNPHLIKAPRECIDYVLLHELAHLKHHDHGSAFWKLIETVDPDWRPKKERLDHMAELLFAQ